VFRCGPIYLELGHRMKFPILLRDGTRASMLQATIREITISPKWQRCGLFTTLVLYLLSRDGCVRVEAVGNPEFKQRFEKSPLWIQQGNNPDCFNPNYARIEQTTPFRLF